MSSRKEQFRFRLSRLSRRIVFWVFISVILIETLIFIPSYKQREKELLSQMKEISVARVVFLLQLTGPEAPGEELYNYFTRLHDGKIIVGGALYRADGKKIGSFGEMPELLISDVKPAEMTFRLNQDKRRYDIAFSPVELQRDYRLILRHDSSAVKAELFAFFLRIAGLVVIISMVVTVGTGLPLRWIVVNPILNLRQDLTRAGEALSKDQQTPQFYSSTVQRNDELGEVIGAFRKMYRQISDAINKRKKAEAEAEHAAILIREKEAQLSTAINSMVGALFMVDKDLNFQVSNEQFWQLYDFPKELAKKGMPYINFLRTRAERGDYGQGDPEELLEKRLEMYKDQAQAKQIVEYEDKLPGNRIAEVFSSSSNFWIKSL